MNHPAPSAAESDAAPSPTEMSPAPRPAETRPATTSAETYPASSPGGLNRSPNAAKQTHRNGYFTRFWRRIRLQLVAVLAAVVVGCAFGFVVAGNDRAMQIFFSV